MNQLATTNQTKYELAVKESRQRFESLSGGHLNYGKEELFALQMLSKNSYSINVATNNPTSVQIAMHNVASVGLTLNPVMGYAFLVPRDGAIVLDVSYKGLIKIATDIGSIKWARTECVYANDKFTYRGPAAMPDIVSDPFGDRGEIKGAYCIAKTPDGDILTECLDMASIIAIRDKSTAFTRAKPGSSKGPWEDFFPEMCRKAVVKRARKTWPYTDSSERLETAIQIANQAEGGYTFEPDAPLTPEQIIEQQKIKRKAEHDAAQDRHSESIDHIKIWIKDGSTEKAYAEWMLIPDEDRDALRLAPTKGGIFSTSEREALRASGEAANAAKREEIRLAEAAAADREIAKGAPQ